MNAIIGMCHFCEQHGPRVLFCTQPIHDQEPLQTLMSNPHCSDIESCASSSIDPDTLHVPSRAASWPLKTRPTSSMPSNASVDGSDIETTSKERCEGCRSLRADQPGFISRDNEAQIRYVSSQQPHQNDVYRVLRQACIRSLSSEVCPGREGPIFFGDSNTQYILSYTFHLKDTKSRGGRRLYSIIVVMMDRIYLLNSWPFLVKHIRNIVTELQSKSDKVHMSEDINRLPRVQLSKERGYTQPTQARLQRTKGSAVRALTHITGDNELFKMIHLTFTWILKACGTRLTEKLLEGPPTEDSIVDLEKKEVITDDGFVLVPTEKIKSASRTRTDSLTSPLHTPGLTGALLADSGTITEESYEHTTPHYLFNNLRDLYQIIGYRSFHQLAHHVIIGNQVIVQADSLPVTKSIIDCLQVLLPRGCCRVIYSSDEYQESFKCNFLGLSKFTCIPEHVLENETYVLVLVENKQCSDNFQSLTCNPLEMYTIQIHTNKPPLDRHAAPAMLEKMEIAMANLKLSWRVVEQAITCIKEEWMNKVKVLFTFTKAGGSRSEDDTKKLLQVLGATPEDKAALKFWMTGLSHQYKNHMRTTVKQI